MAPKKTWFLPPDFTFLENGPIRLGTIIPHPKHPTLALLDPDEISTMTPPVELPSVQVLVESNHSHTDSRGNAIGGEIWARFVELASASLKLDIEWRKDMQYGVVDHEVHSFVRPFTRDTLAAIATHPSVRKHMDGGLWGKQPVYIVSGLRITKTAMSVTEGRGTTRGGGIGVSGPVPAGAMPVEIGVGLHGEMRRDKVDSYETAPGIIFAYRLHCIRQKRDGDVESEMFSHKTTFMTGGVDGDEVVEIEIADVDMLELKDDLEDYGGGFTEYEVGDTDMCISFR
ncbi:hypothetical protein BJX99DRAFT_218426 [Aspergillus californicus]